MAGPEHERQVGAVHRAHALPQFGEVLSMLQALEEIALRSFLAMRQRFEHAVLVEQTRHLVEACWRRASDRIASWRLPVIP